MKSSSALKVGWQSYKYWYFWKRNNKKSRLVKGTLYILCSLDLILLVFHSALTCHPAFTVFSFHGLQLGDPSIQVFLKLWTFFHDFAYMYVHLCAEFVSVQAVTCSDYTTTLWSVENRIRISEMLYKETNRSCFLSETEIENINFEMNQNN